MSLGKADLARAMAHTAMDWPAGVSEIEKAGLTAVPSVDIRPPLVAEAPVAMECQVTQIIPVAGATNVMVLGKIVRFHVREDLYRPDLGLIDTVAMKPIIRLGGPVEYTKIGELFFLPVPKL